MKRLLTILLLIVSANVFGQLKPQPSGTLTPLTTNQAYFRDSDSTYYFYNGTNYLWNYFLNKQQADKLYQPINSPSATPFSLSTGYGLVGSSFDGSVARTWTADTASAGGLVSKSRLATNLGGYVPKTTTLTINGATRDLSTNRVWNVGTVTSVGATAGTGISVSGSPITSSGNITITNTAPDQTVTLTSGTGISTSGTYPNFTITNTSPSPSGLQDSLTKKANRTFDNVASGAIAKAKADTSANGLLPKSNLFPLGDTRWAKLSNLTGYLPLSGGTLTGPLSGTSATFSGNTYLATTSGNALIGTTTDAGFKLDVTGITRLNGLQTFQGTTASDTAPLGAELATTGSGTNWTGTSFATGYTHTAGSVVALTTTLSASIGSYYQLTWTITGRTAGTVNISYGADGINNQSASGNIGIRATTTDVLTITPTTDFNGTIVLSVKQISTSSATTTFTSSTAALSNEIRASNINTNAFYGIQAGRYNTTGNNNIFLGNMSGANNTSGENNVGVGYATLNTNLYGVHNVAIGALSLQNTRGSYNVGIGGQSLINNTTGNYNMAIGAFTMTSNTTGQYNVALGGFALRSNTGNSNIGLGYQALNSNTSFSNNVAIGMTSLRTLSSGAFNIGIGSDAGTFITGGSTSNSTSNNSIFIGHNTRALASGQTNQIVIGHAATGLGSNTISIGNSSTATAAIYGNLLLGTAVDAGYKLDVNGTGRFSGALTANSFVKSGGTSAQFLMGNGTVQDTTTIQTVANFFPKGDSRYQRSSVAPTSISATSPIFYNSGTGVISSQAASASDAGYVTAGTQTFGGNKTFNGTVNGTSSIWSGLMQISRADANSLLVTNTSATHAPIISLNSGTGYLHGFFNSSGAISYINNSGLLEKVGGTDAQFLRANGTALGSTGSGDVVRATSPTLVTPNIGAATGTSVGLTGNSFMQGGLSVGAGSYQDYAGILIGGSNTTGTSQYAFITDAAMNGISNYAGYFNAKLRASTSASNAYGLYVQNAEKGSGATVTNNYGLYIQNQTAGSSINYSIYSAGGANYLAGGLEVPTLKITSGASNGYVLKSDASGNATWQSPTSNYKGTWNASTNTPTIADGSGTTGDYYYVTTGGTQFGRTFVTGGQAVYNGSIWEPVGVAASVTSVNGYTGAVTLAKGDVGLGNVDNTSDATKNAATATLTNKTISGVSNTFSDIPQSAVTSLTTDLGNLMPKLGGAFTGGVTGTTLGLSGSLTNSNSLPFVLSSPTTVDFHQSGGGTVRFVNDAFTNVNMNITNAGNVTVRGDLAAIGAISGSNLSGTNTGDQDLSPYAPLNSPALTGNPTAPTQTQGDNSTKIATTAYVDRLGGGIITSGRYDGLITGGTNVTGTSYTVNGAHYRRIGNEVTVTGRCSLTTTSSGASVFYIDLPIASNLSAGTDLLGAANADTNSTNIVINADTGGDRALVEFTAAGNSFMTVYYNFTYTVL